MANVKETIIEIKKGLKQKNSSQKDEVTVMQEMLNDSSYTVDVYGKGGVEGTYSPYEDFRAMTTSIIASTTKMTKEEAKVLSEGHEVSRREAASMIGISKQFINTYLETRRKLPLGGRETTNFALASKDIPERLKACPLKIGINDDGSSVYETPTKVIPAHTGLRAYASCPSWVKDAVENK